MYERQLANKGVNWEEREGTRMEMNYGEKISWNEN